MSLLKFSARSIAVSLLMVFLLVACAPDGAFVSRSGNDEEISHEGDDAPPPPLSSQEKTQLAQFSEPVLSQAQIDEVMSRYAQLDPNGEVPPALLQKAVVFYDANLAHTQNTSYLTVVDFSRSSSVPRLFVISMSTGAVWKLHVAHGKNSDKNDDGIAESFSNVNGSEQSSLGFYVTAETYTGKHGLSLRLDGLSATNSNVRKREIVMHAATYVYDSDKKAGRSWGCLALPTADRDRAVSILKNGSLIYAGLSQ